MASVWDIRGIIHFLFYHALGINTLHDLIDQSDVEYGTVQGSSLTTILSDMTSEPYATMHTHVMDHLVQNSSEGVKRVRNSYGIPKGMFRNTNMIRLQLSD